MSTSIFSKVSVMVWTLSANKMRSLTMLASSLLRDCHGLRVREPGGSISNFSPGDKSAVRGSVWRKGNGNRRVQ